MTTLLPRDLIDEVIATRRDLHAQPELGFEEVRTAGIVATRLRSYGFEVHEGIGVTGVVGVARSERAGKTIMLRADMDALPLPEENQHAYASRVPGKMHACGHDGHVAMLLGAARLVAERRKELAGTVVFCFQPAEEGRGGAKAMVEAGMLERFGIERAYGLHLFSQLPAGVLGFREGPFYASSDSIEIRIEGHGGHGAAPHLSVDPILVAAEFITSVQKVVSRQVDPVEPAVVTIGAVHGGTTHNVIPSSVSLLGTVRAFDHGVRAKMAERIERVLRGVCDASGATYTFDYLWRYPVTSNDATQTQYVRMLAERTLGETRVATAERHMGAEDFSFFAERVPACYFMLGSSSDARTSYPHHHGKFDIDEAALATGVEIMTALALDAPSHAP
ncbi:MAG: amidohydrolase [Candidatus Eremiobacteraeota bacterium]|nr:amidohydrolase [Candidatus Eremiobacteraeota bacterium]MBC5802407.1 amidohydrolase [Candidatus Eremiobacteraeota bacterium]MBC5820625.1 amidohydrolase [Candidatus Eremiobacteraeota bacterium]